MSDIESDFEEYEDAREREGGLQDGRAPASWGLVYSAAAALGLLLLGALVLALLPR